MELGSLRRLVTARETVSPSRQLRIGAGTCPLTPVAEAWRPLMVSGTSSIASANSVPLRTDAGAARAPRKDHCKRVDTPAGAAPCRKRRRVRARGETKGFIAHLRP